MSATHFPILFRYALDQKGLTSSLNTILDSLAKGSIRNIELDRVRRIVSAAIYSAWRGHVEMRFQGSADASGAADYDHRLMSRFRLCCAQDVLNVSAILLHETHKGLVVDVTLEIILETLPIARDLVKVAQFAYRGRTKPAPPPEHGLALA
jgi:hypothetical protein